MERCLNNRKNQAVLRRRAVRLLESSQSLSTAADLAAIPLVQMLSRLAKMARRHYACQ
jgi:hypothetical protein